MSKNAIIGVLLAALAATFFFGSRELDERERRRLEAVEMWDDHAERLRACLRRCP